MSDIKLKRITKSRILNFLRNMDRDITIDLFDSFT